MTSQQYVWYAIREVVPQRITQRFVFPDSHATGLALSATTSIVLIGASRFPSPFFSSFYYYFNDLSTFKISVVYRQFMYPTSTITTKRGNDCHKI